MPGFYQNLGQVVLMTLMLCGSAFFSGAETAFFNLSRRQIENLAKSNHKLHNLAARITERPRALLNCLLFSNMMVNILFYAAASVLTLRIKNQAGITAATGTACLSFCLLVLFGEILPKSSAYANSRSFSIATAAPLTVLLRVLAPLESVIRFLLVEPVLRLVLGPVRHPQTITVSQFQSLIDQVRQRGLISANENKLLSEIIELGFLKVRHVMQPRVDMPACAVTDSNDSVRRAMLEAALTKIPVYVRKKDNIIGLVHLRQLFLRPDASVDTLVQQVCFVPEQKTVESLLEFFRTRRVDTAIVVDEYGGIAGSVCLEDIVEELLGPMAAGEQEMPIQQLGPFEYRLAGDLAIHDWAAAFGFDPAETRLSTVGGFVTAILGKIPKTGDVARHKNLEFTVERMRKHRIESIILTFDSIAPDD